MAVLVFWTSFALLFYAFIGYPLIIWLVARLKGRASKYDDTYTTTVSMLLSVFNEELVIRAKIVNFLNLDYPPDKLELLVISDGCTDSTEEIVRSFESERIRLFVQEQRGGKTLALNRGAVEARGEILVFTDANSMFRPDSMSRLMAPFAAPGIGLVSGRSVYIDESGQETLGGLYRRYEEWIKNAESRLYSIVGADGAIYAMRKSIFQPLQPIFINDLLHPFQVVKSGLAAVTEPLAVVMETDAEDCSAELKRQTRIMAQSWHTCVQHLGGLNQAGKFGFLWQVVSHKILRWLTIPLIACLGVSSLSVLPGVFVVYVLLGVFCLFSFAWRESFRNNKIVKATWMFVILHLASILGLWKLAKKEYFVTWSPRKN